MRISGIFVLLALSFISEGTCAWWAAAARGMEPVILSFGAAFAALGLKDQSSHDGQLFDVKGWFKNKFESEDEASEYYKKGLFKSEKKEDKAKEKKEEETFSPE